MIYCRRCQGLMTVEDCEEKGVVVRAYRCLLCGELVDGLIARHRQGYRAVGESPKGKKLGARLFRNIAIPIMMGGSGE